jgi:glycosyltransferase involved in cell wall biosynthesis
MSDLGDRAGRRLLLVTHRPLQYAGPGSVRWRYLIDALPAHGWDVDVLSARANPTQDELSADPRAASLARARARVMGSAGRMLRSTYNRAGIQPEAFPPHTLWTVTGSRSLRRRLAETPPDVAVATTPPMSATFLCASHLHGRVPLVVDMRDNWAGHPSYDAGGALLRRIEGRALATADRIVVVTAGMVEKLRLLHPQLAERIQLMPNGYDPQLLVRRVAAPARWPERVRLIHPGVLYGDRGVDALLAALARPALRGRVTLELVGNVTPATAAAVRRAGDAVDVVVTPPQTWEDAMARVEAADIVAVIVPASMGDDVAWPVKMFEALALGKPVLSVTAGGATEALLRELGEDHALARDGDADSIARALTRLLAAPPPPPVAPQRIARWDRARVAAEYAALLDDVVR